MTSGQPPQPSYGGQQPEHGQPPAPGGPPPYGQQTPYGQPPPPPGRPPYGPPPQYGHPQYGHPQYGQPQYGPPPGQQSYSQPYSQPYSQQPYGQPPPMGVSARSGAGFDLKKLTMADYVIAAGTVLFFVLALFPWWSYGDDLFGYSLSGFDDGRVSSAFLLFVLATVWTVLPAFVDVQLGFPRAWVTVGLAGLGFVLTLFTWLASMSASFQVWPLLGTVTAAVILLFAILSLLPQLRNRPALPGSLAGAAQWAGQPAPDFGQPGRSAPAQNQPTYGQPAPPPPPPPTPGGTSAAGGATASGEGPSGSDRPIGS